MARRELVDDASDGSYQYELARTDTGHYVRVEANGYLPAISPMFKLGDKDEVTFNFELTRGNNIEGFVKDSQGNDV